MGDRPRVTVYRFEHREIDLGRRELRNAGARVPLGGKAFDILEVLVTAAGTLITKDELADRVWPGTIVDDNALHVHISAIRKALGRDRELIKTTSRRGYRLLGDWIAEHGAVNADPSGSAAHVRPSLPNAGNLPIARTELIGREAAARQVADLVSAHRVVTLVGPGGIGKTRLGLAVAEGLRPAFPDGVWLIDLSPLSDPNLVLSATLGALGFAPQPVETSPERVAHAIGEKRLLMLLDNCEHVVDAAACMVETIARICGGTSILATSREPLRVDGEGVYRVPPLSVPAIVPASDPAMAHQTEPEALLQHSAIRLFLARSRALEPDREDYSACLADVAAICRRLDGIPLAIELAAATAAALGLAATVRHLDNRFELLTRGRRTAPPRQRTLLATLDWSYELLSESERRILRRLAVFAGGFTLDGACAVAAAQDTGSRDIIDRVASLVSKSLVAVESTAGATRYSLQETVRAYALDKLSASGETDAAMRSHAAFCVDLLQRARAVWADQPVHVWRAVYRPEIDNVRIALDWAFSSRGDATIAVLLSTASIPLMFDLSLIAECHGHAEKALRLVNAGVRPDPGCEMSLLTALQASRIYIEGPSAEAFAAWETILARAAVHDDAEHQARALWGLWNDHVYHGSPAVALVFARRFTDLAAARGDTAKAVLGQRITGISLHYHGDQGAALDHLEQFLGRYDREAHRWQTVGSRLDYATVTQATLVRVLWLQGQPDAALRINAAAVHDAMTEDHLMSLLYVLVEGAIPLALAVGDMAATERYVGILLEQAGRSGFRIWQIYAACLPEVLRVRRGGLGTSLTRLTAAIDALRDTGFCAHLTMFLGALARGHEAAGRTAEGLLAINEALDRARQHDEGWNFAELLRIKAELVLGESSATADADAETLLHQSLLEARSRGALSWELRAATSLARLLRRQGSPAIARRVLSAVYERFREGFETADLAVARGLLAEL